MTIRDSTAPRRPALLILLLGFALISSACTGGGGGEDGADQRSNPTDRTPSPRTVDGLQTLAIADPSGFTLYTEGAEVDFLTGVNVGSAIPGRLPAELEIEEETWRRWFPMIADTGVHAIRVYTVQPPRFYRALRDYNLANPSRPLYLVHGVWIPEELLVETRDLFDPTVLSRIRTDIDDAVDAIHGEAELPERRGYASGTFTADVSPWLVSWAFGIEMDPEVVRDSDALNAAMSENGAADREESDERDSYVAATAEATPTERWLAEMLDRIAAREASYGISVPLTFSNWPTTDPLDHPYEPIPNEDLVGIDANHLETTSAWPAGMYASYHAYPYYPDFQRYEPGIADFEFQGRIDPYAGYLEKLRAHHAKAGLPVMILEFGVPTSIGSAHNGSLGRDQGGHHEAEAMAINGNMLRTQSQLGLAGGFVFNWQDEWFKRTWNTMDTEAPAGRRQLWQNPLTNEAHFGLLAIEPGADGPPVYIRGDGADWTPTNSQVIHESTTGVREVRAIHDEAYLYLRLTLDRDEAWLSEPVVIGFDTVPDGNGGLPEIVDPSCRCDGADTAVVIGPGDEARALIRASNDYNDLLLGRRLGFTTVTDTDLEAGSGVWNPQRLNVNRPLLIPLLNELKAAEFFELNPLVNGSSDPADSNFDSRTVWAADDRVIELRIPWAIVGLADPSSRAALLIAADGTPSTSEVERLGIDVALGNNAARTAGYAWEPWNAVTWSERPKAGLELLTAAVVEVTSTSRPSDSDG